MSKKKGSNKAIIILFGLGAAAMLMNASPVSSSSQPDNKKKEDDNKPVPTPNIPIPKSDDKPIPQDNKPNNPVSPIAPDKDDHNRFDNLIKREAAKYNYNWLYLKALMGVESNYGYSAFYLNKQAGAGGKAGLFGITDIARNSMNNLLKTKYTRDDLWNAEISIIVAARLLKWLLDYFAKSNDKLKLAIKGYNVGYGNVNNAKYAAQATNYYNSWVQAYNKAKV